MSVKSTGNGNSSPDPKNFPADDAHSAKHEDPTIGASMRLRLDTVT
jgi:hypothetical protein